MLKKIRVIFAAATVALGLILTSSLAHAEFIDYEFIDGPFSDSRLSGTFSYNGETDFRDISMTVPFGGGIGDVIFDTLIPVNPDLGGEHYFHFESSLFAQRTDLLSPVDPALLIDRKILEASTPLLFDTGNLFWFALALDEPISSTGKKYFSPITIGELRISDRGLDIAGLPRTAFQVAPVPEPSTYAMMAIGLLGIAGMRRRQNKA